MKRAHNRNQHAAAPIASEVRAFICFVCEEARLAILGHWTGEPRPCADCGLTCDGGAVVVSR